MTHNAMVLMLGLIAIVCDLETEKFCGLSFLKQHGASRFHNRKVFQRFDTHLPSLCQSFPQHLGAGFDEVSSQSHPGPISYARV